VSHGAAASACRQADRPHVVRVDEVAGVGCGAGMAWWAPGSDLLNAGWAPLVGAGAVIGN
jgi:hypothetical protein